MDPLLHILQILILDLDELQCSLLIAPTRAQHVEEEGNVDHDKDSQRGLHQQTNHLLFIVTYRMIHELL